VNFTAKAGQIYSFQAYNFDVFKNNSKTLTDKLFKAGEKSSEIVEFVYGY